MKRQNVGRLSLLRPSNFSSWNLQLLWAFLGSVGLALVFARVALFNLTSGVVGGNLDGYNNVWNYYWLKTALVDLHRNPFFTDYIYYPTGTSLRFHTFNPFNGLVTMPLNVTIGYVPTVNLVFVFAPIFTALFAFLLIRDLVGDSLAAFAGAAIAAYADYHIAVFLTVGQSSYITLQFIPLFFFLLFRALHGRVASGEWRVAREADNSQVDTRYSILRNALYVVLCIITLLCITLTDWQYLMFTFFATLLYSLFLLFSRRSWNEKARLFGKLAIIGGVYAVIVTPTLLLPMVREAANSPWLDISYQADLHSVDLGWLVSPGIGIHGLVILGLAAVGLWRAVRAGGSARSRAFFWVLVIGFFYAMSLGPVLTVNGDPASLPMPYAVLQKLPVISSGRDPGRFTLLATLGMGVLAAFGVRALLGFLARRVAVGASGVVWQSVIRVVLVAALLAVALSATMTASGQAKVDPPLWPPFYEQLAKDTEDYAILELPLFSDEGLGADHYQMYQALHHKLRYSGRLARDRKLDNPNNFVKRSSLFRHLWMLDLPRSMTDLYYPERDILTRTDYATQGLSILNYYDTRYIIAYKDAITSDNWVRMEDVLRRVLGAGLRPFYEDEMMRVYKVPDAPEAPARMLTLDVGDGWYASEVGKDGIAYRWADSAPVETKSGYVITPTAQLYTMNLSQETAHTVLSFTTYPYKQSRTLKVTINGYVAATLQLKPEDGARRVSLEVEMPSGNNLIEFITPEPPLPTDNREADARLLSFVVQEVSLR